MMEIKPEIEEYTRELIERWNAVLATKTMSQMLVKDEDLVNMIGGLVSAVKETAEAIDARAMVPAMLILGAFLASEGLLNIEERVAH